MSEPALTNPFSPRAVLGLVLFGAVAFIALLWMIGTNYDGGNTNDGQAHVAGQGLNGYAGLARYLEKRGYPVQRSRSEKVGERPGLLVLTPPTLADGKEIERLVKAHRYVGPTMVITPKWFAARAAPTEAGMKQGWVHLAGATEPVWKGFRDDIAVSVKPGADGWTGMGSGGRLADPTQVLSGAGSALVPLVEGADGRILAAFVADGGYYPALEDAAPRLPPSLYEQEEDNEIYPLVLVFEPDLLNNFGLARQEQARLADALFAATLDGNEKRIAFDLTLNGFGRSPNLLTLAFTPPFLAATLCLLLAALAIGWRGFNRFGPPRAIGRAIAFGKRALVANAAGLIRRTRRLHLIGPPYADAARERLSRALALPGSSDVMASEAAIDRAVAARSPAATPFSEAAAAMRAARRPADLLRAAQSLHALERMLKR
jgi:hypothetical protein